MCFLNGQSIVVVYKLFILLDLATILNIETATPLCSVSLARDGNTLALRETLEEKSHAELLSLFITGLLQEHGLTVNDLDAVAVGMGPGSYTGLRIGVSTAKGICYGAGLPLIALGTLKTLYFQLIKNASSEIREWLLDPGTLVCPMIDARRMEVYSALYDKNGNELEKISAKVIDGESYRHLLDNHKIIFTGTGMNKCRQLLEHPNSYFADNIYPSADSMSWPSENAYHKKDFVDLAYFEPFYLKDFLTTPPKKGLH